mmetsp:Transcript_4341/g.9925  ORF Transcript_4341/g.9925 Transcript_4341/m.9925 type:complete len:319 (-) Transcript_4341:31-987(-)
MRYPFHRPERQSRECSRELVECRPPVLGELLQDGGAREVLGAAALHREVLESGHVCGQHGLQPLVGQKMAEVERQHADVGGDGALGGLEGQRQNERDGRILELVELRQVQQRLGGLVSDRQHQRQHLGRHKSGVIALETGEVELPDGPCLVVEPSAAHAHRQQRPHVIELGAQPQQHQRPRHRLLPPRRSLRPLPLLRIVESAPVALVGLRVAVRQGVALVGMYLAHTRHRVEPIGEVGRYRRFRHDAVVLRYLLGTSWVDGIAGWWDALCWLRGREGRPQSFLSGSGIRQQPVRTGRAPRSAGAVSRQNRTKTLSLP